MDAKDQTTNQVMEDQIRDQSANWLRSVEAARAIQQERLARVPLGLGGTLHGGLLHPGLGMNPLLAMPPVGLVGASIAGYGEHALAAAAASRRDPFVEASIMASLARQRNALLRPPASASSLPVVDVDADAFSTAAAGEPPVADAIDSSSRSAGTTASGNITSTGVAYTKAGGKFAAASGSGDSSSRKRPTKAPHSYKENSALSQWVQRQRYQYRLRQEGKRSTLTDERVNLLEDAGFVWNSHQTVWEDRLQELLEYKKKHGNCVVPSNYKANPQLALWVKRQRRQYKFYKQKEQTSMTPERIAKLEKIGFAWDCRNIPKEKPDNTSPEITSKPPRRAPSPTASSNVSEGEEHPAISSATESHNAASSASIAGMAAAHAAAAAATPSTIDAAYSRLAGASAHLAMLAPGTALPLHPHTHHLAPSSLLPLGSPLMDSRLLMAQRPIAVPLSLLQHAKQLPPSYLGHPGAYSPYLP